MRENRKNTPPAHTHTKLPFITNRPLQGQRLCYHCYASTKTPVNHPSLWKHQSDLLYNTLDKLYETAPSLSLSLSLSRLLFSQRNCFSHDAFNKLHKTKKKRQRVMNAGIFYLNKPCELSLRAAIFKNAQVSMCFALLFQS